MPEGDSVYRQCKMLREALEGAVVESSDFRVPALATSDVFGRTVVAVVPRGKHILIRLSAAPDAEPPLPRGAVYVRHVDIPRGQ